MSTTTATRRLAPILVEERRLRFRIDVNLGEVIADGGDIDGEGCAMCCKEACVDRATGSDATPS
jgi:hypothetical protein